ncbi:Alg9-like mannosyltransferase family-domain-containing protein [Tirmania nivea]|nr:Alg9-like mannosyltransferase family-domain-containing protein [Tirmania nivea]
MSQPPVPPHLLFPFVLSIRVINAVSVSTFFQPDEYFQALEPAWRMVFGEGWLTWEWREELRSIAHPLIFSWLYKGTYFILKGLGIHDEAVRGDIFNVAPRLLQAVFATLGDIYTYKLGTKTLGEEAGWTSLFLSLGSAFHWFCSTRTFSNSLETSLTIIALYYWPWPSKEEKTAKRVVLNGPETSLKMSLGFAAVASILRPTNALIWATLGAFLYFRASMRAERILIVSEAAKIGVSVIVLNMLLDRRYYGHFTFPPWKFLKFNLVQSLSIFYGSMPWHYYLSQGLPLLLTFYSPLAIQEISSVLEKVADVLTHNTEQKQALLQQKKSDSATAPPKPLKALSPSLATRMQFSVATIATTLVYSLIKHKEVRFIYPLLPMLIILTASALHNPIHFSPAARKKLLFALLAANLPIAYYSTQMHQRGVIDVVNYLRHDQNNWRSVGFLMPCHSTPWMASLQVPSTKHRDIWALTCEPPVNLSPQEKSTYLDEADHFYADPIAFLKANFPVPPRKGGNPKKRMREETRYQWPERLVMFEVLEKVLREYWGGDDSRYRSCARFFNSHFHDDKRRKGDVVVYCLEKDGAKGGEALNG